MTRWYSRVFIQDKNREIADALRVGFHSSLTKYHEVCTMYNLHVVLCCVLYVHMFTSECVFDYVLNTCLLVHICILLHNYNYLSGQSDST